MVEKIAGLAQAIRYDAVKLKEGLWTDEQELLRIGRTLRSGTDVSLRAVVFRARLAANLTRQMLPDVSVSRDEFTHTVSVAEGMAADSWGHPYLKPAK